LRTRKQARHAQQAIVFVALLLFNIVLLTVQLWLFVGALEGLLRGGTMMPVPAFAISLVIFAVNGWMYLGIRRMERQS
jgi:predicted Co/Zn/Cd cation transporter (cation efflux family)